MNKKKDKPAPSPGGTPTSHHDYPEPKASPDQVDTSRKPSSEVSVASPTGTPTSYYGRVRDEEAKVPKPSKPVSKPKPLPQVKKSTTPLRKISILYVISTTRIGGAETALKRLLRNIDKTLYRTEVVVSHESGPLHNEYKIFSDHLTYLKGEKLESTLISKVKSGKYDYLHFFNLFDIYPLLPKLKATSPKLKIISSIMIVPSLFENSWCDKYVTIQKNAKYLHTLIVDSQSLKKLFPSSTIIKNGVNLETFSPLTKKKPRTVTWIGRISTSKKAYLVPQIARELPDYEFTMVGSEKTLEYNKIMKMGGASLPPNLNVLFGLSERQIADILAESEYVVFTSYGESMPISVLESMASECCVIAESVGDLPYLIQHGVNGYLIPNDADVVAWIQKKIGVLNKKVGEVARKKIIHEHNIDNTVKQHEFLYGRMGRHHDQTRIAFVWSYQKSYEREFWDTKIDSLQHSIQELSKNNVVQVILPVNSSSRREIIHGQNTYFVNWASKEEIINELRRFRPHMIFMNMFHGLMWPKIISAFPGVWKSVMHYGSKILHLPYANSLDAILVQMEYLRPLVAKANKISINKVHHAPFCIEQWLFKPKESTKEYTGVMLADFRKIVKRQDLLIQAWKNIPGKLLLIGRFERSMPRNYHRFCMDLAAKLGIRDKITFQDGCPHTQIPDLLNKAQIAFLTSSHEGGSRALKEMMACGLPGLVLSDCAGNVNMIKNGVDGLIADPTPESIVETALELIKRQKDMGAKASNRMRKTYPYHVMHSVFRGLMIKTRPEVSILTTSMNLGGFIEENIRSIINQKRPFSCKVNHLILDGGSKDETPNILMKYRNHIYYYIRRDQGQTDALVQAMKFVEQQFPQTVYVGWINADDYYQTNWLDDSISQIRHEPHNVAMTCGDINRVGLHTGILNYTSQRYIDLGLIANRGNIIFQPTVLIRMSAFKALKDKYGFYFNPNIHYVQDLELWYRFLINGYKIKHLTKGEIGFNVVANLRSHPEQMSRTHMTLQIVERDKILREISAKSGVKGLPWVKQ